MDQAYKDQMLSETERLREEEETLAEIERIRERSGGEFSPSTNLTVNIIANVIAFAGVLIAVILAGPQLQGLGPLLTEMLQRGWPAILLSILATLIAAVAAVVVLYLLLHEVADPFIRGFAKRRRCARQGEEQYYYEMDLRLDAAIADERAQLLMAGDFSGRREWAEGAKLAGRAPRLAPRVDRWHVCRWDHRPARNSYRVNRSGPDEALHKLYVVAAIVWPRRFLPLPWFARRRMRIFLVYEALFHNPSDAPRYVFKALRIVSTSDNLLPPAHIKQLQLLIVAEFVNRWISPPSKLLTERDALLSLVRKA